MNKHLGYCENCEALTDTYPFCWECENENLQNSIEVSEEFIVALANAVRNGKIGEDL
jgi:hypothetical protein